MKALVIGAAGFIDMYDVCKRLLVWGDEVVDVDNLIGNYDASVKGARLTLATAVNEGMRRSAQWYRGYCDNNIAA